MAKVIDVNGLSQAATQYDSILRTLPYFALEALAHKLRLNILHVQDEHILVNKRRKAGATGPYKDGMTITYQEEVSKFFETKLKPELAVCKVKDSILNYTDKKALVVAGAKLDLKKKKHPLEYEIVRDMVISHGEDVVFSIFHAERDEDTFSPMTAFTGFFPHLDALTTAGHIGVAQKNVHNTGEIVLPTDSSTEAYDKLVEFVASGHPMLRSSEGGIPQLLVTQNVLIAARKAFRNKLKTFDYPSMEQMLESVREDAFCPNLVFSTHEALGMGGKMILQKSGNMDIGFDTSKSAKSRKFVQVRDPFEDPNYVQFWLQAKYGVRVRDIHPKKFLTNEQTNTAVNLAGDYD